MVQLINKGTKDHQFVPAAKGCTHPPQPDVIWISVTQITTNVEDFYPHKKLNPEVSNPPPCEEMTTLSNPKRYGLGVCIGCDINVWVVSSSVILDGPV